MGKLRSLVARAGHWFATSRWSGYALAGCVGLAAALWLIPPATLLAENGFVSPYEMDAGAHIIAQRYFLADEWHWHILRVSALVWPQGTNIGLADGIPLVALPLKLIAAWLPMGFHGIYLWLALVYFLQPVSAVYAIRGTGETRVVPSVAIAVMAISMPVLWARAVHSALSAQFLVLMALGLYIRLCGVRPRRSLAGAAAVLLPVSLLVHPYLMMMVAAVLAAAPVSLLIHRNAFWRVAAGGVGAGVLATVTLAWALGYTKAVPSPGFGDFSMNLLSPIMPSRSGLFPTASIQYGSAGQADGFNYLGAGLIVLTGVGLLSLRRGRWWGILKRHAGLAACCLILTFLALSNRCFAGTTLVYDLGPVPSWIEQFRCSGRFFWPVAYSALIFGCVANARSLRSRLLVPVLAAVCILQFADVGGLRAYAWNVVNVRHPWQLNTSLIRPILAHHGLLRLIPEFGCGGSPLDDVDFREMTELASERAMPINTAYVSRFERMPICNEADGMPLQSGELRAYLADAAEHAGMTPDAAKYCRRAANIIFCTLDGASLASIRDADPPSAMALNSAESVSSPGAKPVLEAGWCSREDRGVWTCSSHASVLMSVRGASAASLILSGIAMAPAAGETQDVIVSINGHAVKKLELADNNRFREAVDIPKETDFRRPVEVSFTIGHPVSPAQRDINGDTRMLGLWLSTIEFDG